jgi:hypothetical protein
VRRVAPLTPGEDNAIIAVFHEDRADESTVRPVIIYWDVASEKYAIKALIPTAPELIPFARPGVRTAGYQREYIQTEHLLDPRSDTVVTPYATSAFTTCKSPTGLVTVGAYWLSEGGPGPPTLQLSDSRI